MAAAAAITSGFVDVSNIRCTVVDLLYMLSVEGDLTGRNFLQIAPTNSDPGV
jgi:hypothetical protein